MPEPLLSDPSAVMKYQPLPQEAEFHRQLDRGLKERPDRLDPLFHQPDVQIQLLDRMITVVKMDELEADIWMEDERDVCFHIVPAKGASTFLNHAMFKTQSDKVFERVFGKVSGVMAMAALYGFRYGDLAIIRKTDATRRGIDLLDVRMVSLWTKPNAAKYAVEVVVMLDDVLTGRRPLVEL